MENNNKMVVYAKHAQREISHVKKEKKKNNRSTKQQLRLKYHKKFSQSVPVVEVRKWLDHFKAFPDDGPTERKGSGYSRTMGTAMEIPFLKAVFFKGTQVVSLRCRCGTTVLASSAGSQILTVVAPTLAAVMITTPLQSTWSEYRCKGGRLIYVPAFEGGVITNSGIIVWVIDYVSATALSTYNGGVVYDTMKIKPTFEKMKMEAHVEPLPDQDWIPITTTGTIFFYFKAYADATTGVGVSTSYGLYWTELDLEFRGID